MQMTQVLCHSGETGEQTRTAEDRLSVCDVLSVRLPDNVDGAISLLRRISHANAIRTAAVNALALPPSYRDLVVKPK